jgi:hypothetical protein
MKALELPGSTGRSLHLPEFDAAPPGAATLGAV